MFQTTTLINFFFNFLATKTFLKAYTMFKIKSKECLKIEIYKQYFEKKSDYQVIS